jgi:hypothetical protein
LAIQPWLNALACAVIVPIYARSARRWWHGDLGFISSCVGAAPTSAKPVQQSAVNTTHNNDVANAPKRVVNALLSAGKWLPN